MIRAERRGKREIMAANESENQEYELRKKAIFDSMSKRGQERILRMGYDNWEPFQEPKDPRERIFSTESLRASAIVQEFYKAQGGQEESVALNKELFELCKGMLMDEPRAKTIYAFCTWYKEKLGR